MRIFNKLFLFLFCCLFSCEVFASSANISLDKKVLTEADILTLTLSYNGTDGATPDLSGLQNDFQIVSNSTSQRINYINGVVQQTKQWSFGLRPLRTGKITINPIRIGNVRSNYEEIEVKEVSDVAFVPDSQENSNSPYFQINMDYEPKSPYLQQQTTLLVTIYDSLGLKNSALDITEETKNNWAILPLLSKPIVKRTTLNNKNVNAITYAFAAFPLKDGNIPAPQFLFDGAYIKNSDFGFPRIFDDFMAFGIDFQNVMGQQVPVNMKTKPFQITVKESPAGFSGKWLPLYDLSIKSSWTSSSKFKVGEAVSRKITVTASGISKDMFPELTFPDIDGFKQYPEKPELEMTVNDGKLVTAATINIVYIPTKSGHFVFPAQEIDWFNVQTGLFEKATLPAEEVEILINPSVGQNISQPTPVMETTPQQDTISPASSDFSENGKTSTANPDTLPLSDMMFYCFIFVAFLLGFLLFGLLLWLKNVLSKQNRSYYRKQVVNAVKQGDFKAVQKALLEWGRFKFGVDLIKNLKQLAELADDDKFSQQLDALNEALYAGTAKNFDAATFIALFKKIDRQKKTLRENKEILPNLYD